MALPIEQAKLITAMPQSRVTCTICVKAPCWKQGAYWLLRMWEPCRVIQGAFWWLSSKIIKLLRHTACFTVALRWYQKYCCLCSLKGVVLFPELCVEFVCNAKTCECKSVRAGGTSGRTAMLGVLQRCDCCTARFLNVCVTPACVAVVAHALFWLVAHFFYTCALQNSYWSCMPLKHKSN